jgi:hypothetical protein
MLHWPQYSLRTMLLLMAAAVPLFWFVAQFTRVETQHVDPVTGALKRTTSYWWIQTSEVVETTILGSWLAEHGQGQPPQWKFLSYERWSARGCGEAAPIYYLRSWMPRVLELLSEDELLALTQILRHGTHDEQMAAVEAIEKRLSAR